ncbi:hypothetical protein ACH5RR_036726 [Cinchona calisaya]|uniref:Transposase MuDR plant domain-containing protein n=1 Tax=Cinchona calisaya TaxID=153742 RepID=A0ABD2Y8T2_9GENT
MMVERAKENQAIEITRNEDGGSDSDVDNSDKDDAANSMAEFESLHGSYKEQGIQYPVFDPKDMDNPNLEVGMVFSSFREFNTAIRSWNIKRGRQIKFVKSGKIRVSDGCLKKGCDWEIYARKMKGTGIIQFRTFRAKHKCGFVYYNKCVKSTWVANKYKAEIQLNPRIDLPSFRRKVMNENKFFLSKDQGYRAKRLALCMIHGSVEDQYNRLNDYIHEVKRSNPGTTIVMKMVDGYYDTSTNRPKFQRLYMCFAAVRAGFLAGSRPLFGLDGAFLKGPSGEMLLTAIGIGPNIEFFPIAYAACEGENKYS